MIADGLATRWECGEFVYLHFLHSAQFGLHCSKPGSMVRAFHCLVIGCGRDCHVVVGAGETMLLIALDGDGGLLLDDDACHDLCDVCILLDGW